MSPNQKLASEIDTALFSNKNKFSGWERDFLASMSRILSNKNPPASLKQWRQVAWKDRVKEILKKHND
jgi:hypothetical protein